MGDVIKTVGKITVGKITVGKSELEIELNKSASGGRCRDIHLQNDKFRLEIPENEFLPMLACVLSAKKQFDIIKGGAND